MLTLRANREKQVEVASSLLCSDTFLERVPAESIKKKKKQNETHLNDLEKKRFVAPLPTACYTTDSCSGNSYLYRFYLYSVVLLLLIGRGKRRGKGIAALVLFLANLF